MELKDYLRELRETSDEELKSRCGIDDNYSILVKGDFNRLTWNMHYSNKFRLFEVFKMPLRKGGRLVMYKYEYVPGSVTINAVSPSSFPKNSPLDLGLTDEQIESLKQEVRSYDLSLDFHPILHRGWANPEKAREISGVKNWERAMAITIEDTIQYLLEQKLPICLLCTRQWGNQNDVSDIIRV